MQSTSVQVRSLKCNYCVGRQSSVSIATCYGMDGPGSNPGRDKIFLNGQNWHCGLASLLKNWCRVPFPAVKRPGRGVDHPTPTNSEAKERVQLYVYSTSTPSWPVPRRTLPSHVVIFVDKMENIMLYFIFHCITITMYLQFNLQNLHRCWLHCDFRVIKF
jgi:hypothetical protein